MRAIHVQAVEGVGLFVVGVPDAAHEVQAVGRMNLEVRKRGGAAVADRVIRQEVVQIDRDGDPVLLQVVRLVVEAAHGEVRQLADVARQAELLGELLVGVGQSLLEQIQGRAVWVVDRRSPGLPVGSDRFQAEIVGQFVVDRPGDAPSVDVVLERVGEGVGRDLVGRAEQRREIAADIRTRVVGVTSRRGDEAAVVGDAGERISGHVTADRRIVAIEHLGRRKLGVVPRAVDDEVDLERRAGGRVPESRAQGDQVPAAFMPGHAVVGRTGGRNPAAGIDTAVVQLGHEPVAMLFNPRNSGVEPIGDGEVRAAAQVHALVGAVSPFQEASTGAVRRLGIEFDRPAQGVLACQGALRTTQDFDPVEIGEIHHRAEGRAVVDVVDIDAHARLEREAALLLADAADEGGDGVGLDAWRHRQVHVRSEVGEVDNVGLAAGLQRRRLDCGDGDGGILQVLPPELGGHHHLAHARALVGPCSRGGLRIG